VATAWATMEAIAADWAAAADSLAPALTAAVFELELPDDNVDATTIPTTTAAAVDATVTTTVRLFFGAAGGAGSYCGKSERCWSEGIRDSWPDAAAGATGSGSALGESDGSQEDMNLILKQRADPMARRPPSRTRDRIRYGSALTSSVSGLRRPV